MKTREKLQKPVAVSFVTDDGLKTVRTDKLKEVIAAHAQWITALNHKHKPQTRAARIAIVEDALAQAIRDPDERASVKNVLLPPGVFTGSENQ